MRLMSPWKQLNAFKAKEKVTGEPAIPFGMESPVSAGIHSTHTSMTSLLRTSNASELVSGNAANFSRTQGNGEVCLLLTLSVSQCNGLCAFQRKMGDSLFLFFGLK